MIGDVAPRGGDLGFGRQLRRYRLVSGLSQVELAERSGLSARTIAYMESGRTSRPYRGSVLSLADALELAGPDRQELLRASRRTGLSPVLGTHDIVAGPGSVGQSATQTQRAGNTGGSTGSPLFTVVPRQLPASVRSFTGRTAEMRVLDGLLGRLGDGQSCALVSIVAGQAGTGKTALAAHWAHRAAGHFPDGQLYLNMRGSAPSGSPVTPVNALRSLIAGWQLPRGRLPANLDALVGLYRSLMASRRMLVLLDDARDAEQVRPLLPASPGCLALLTSRSGLTSCTGLISLIAAEDAAVVWLGRLTDADALNLIASRLGWYRVSREPAATAELIRLSAGLPGVLTNFAARAVAAPGRPLASLAAELRRPQRLLAQPPPPALRG
jgi:DNA-binding XRE family transcriptional regulator